MPAPGLDWSESQAPAVSRMTMRIAAMPARAMKRPPRTEAGMAKAGLAG
jgi:hypothetical protein